MKLLLDDGSGGLESVTPGVLKNQRYEITFSVQREREFYKAQIQINSEVIEERSLKVTA